MRIIVTGALLASAIALAGCQSTTSATIQTDAANTAAVAKTLACDLSEVANIVEVTAAAVNSGTAVPKDAQTVLVASSAACLALGGNPLPAP